MWLTLAGGAALVLTLVQASAASAEPAKSTPRAKAAKATKVTTLARSSKATKAKPMTMAEQEAANANDPTQPPRGLGAGGMDAMFDDVNADASGAPQAPAKSAPQILNRSEMLSLARKYSAEIAGALVDGERHRAAAVREKDAIKLACIQDRLSNMKTMKRLSDERLAATERPVIRDDELNLRHEFRGVEMAYNRVIELRRELIDCVGESLQVEGPAGTTPTSSDPTGTNAEIPRTERPTPASPFN